MSGGSRTAEGRSTGKGDAGGSGSDGPSGVGSGDPSSSPSHRESHRESQRESHRESHREGLVLQLVDDEARGIEHPSHTAATELLRPFEGSLGPAYATLHLIARWSVEHAQPDDPAPHMLTTYWSLSEATGRSQRTIARHLHEGRHPWSETVRWLIDIRRNFGQRVCAGRSVPCVVGLVIRFFPRGRRSPNARVRRYGVRDLVAESDARRTFHTRPVARRSEPYERLAPRMSVYSPVTTLTEYYNWLFVRIASTATTVEPTSANLYPDIRKQDLLVTLRDELGWQVRFAEQRGRSVARARHGWVESASRVLSDAFDLRRAARVKAHPGADGNPDRGSDARARDFTDLWRRLLWAAVRAELYGGTRHPWFLLERMCKLALEADELGKRNPIAWAWTVTREAGYAQVLRDDAQRERARERSHRRSNRPSNRRSREPSDRAVR